MHKGQDQVNFVEVYEFPNYPIYFPWPEFIIANSADEMSRLHLLRASYDLFVYDFPYDFSGIVGDYKLLQVQTHDPSIAVHMVHRSQIAIDVIISGSIGPSVYIVCR